MSLRRRTVHALIAAGLLVMALAPPAAASGSTGFSGASGSSGSSGSSGESGASGASGSSWHGDGVRLRVATYNIHAGAGADNVFDLDRQTTQLRAMDADVIGLQEADSHWGTRSEWRDLAGELADRLDMRVSFAPIYSLDPASPSEPRREYGVAVLSRYRIVSAENHEITRLSTQDPNPVPAPAPGFGEVVLRVKGLPVHVYVTHLDYRPDPSVRVAQVADTRRIMAQDPGPKILLGDLNAEPEAPELAPLWQELTDADPAAPTFPALNPVKRIDFVAVSRADDGPGGHSAEVRVHDAAVPGTLASDHRPVVADLVLRRH